MLDRFFALLGAIVFFLWGIQALFSRQVVIKSTMENSDLNFGYLWLIVGVLCLCLSFALLYMTFRSQKNIKKYPEYLKCLNCETTWWFGHVKNSKDKCPNCGGKLVDLEKYETHKNRERNLENRKNKPKKRSVRNKRKNNKGNENE